MAISEYQSEEPTEEEKIEIAREYANLSEDEKGEQMHQRYEELMRTTDMSSQTAQSAVQEESREMERLVDKYRLRSKEDYSDEEDISEEDTDEESDEDERMLWKGSESDKIDTDIYKEKYKSTPEYEELSEGRYQKTREGLSRGLKTAEDVAKGIIGVGSREPIKEVLISGAAKAIEAIKGKPKTKAELKLEADLKNKQKLYKLKEEHVRRLAEAKLSGKRRYRDPSIRNIGLGDMGTKEYQVTQRSPVGKVEGVGVKSLDFLGTSEFSMGMTNPMGRQKYTSGELKPPSTSIPYGGSKPPSVSLGSAPSRPPSVSLGGTKISPPSLSFGYGKPLNPLGEVKQKPVTVEKLNKKIKIKKTKEVVQKTQLKPKKTVEDLLGTKGLF